MKWYERLPYFITYLFNIIVPIYIIQNMFQGKTSLISAILVTVFCVLNVIGFIGINYRLGHYIEKSENNCK